MKKAFIYIRVSTQEQVLGYSIQEQEERLEAYAKARGYIVVKKFVDPGHSGATLDRPSLKVMIDEIKSTDIVLVYKLDRLSRSQKDTLYLIEEVFLKNDIDFISVVESFDTSTPFGRAMIGILSVFAQLEREQIRERSMMGKHARAKAGLWHGGGRSKVVTGYDYVDGYLRINDYEAECVRFIYDSYMSGTGLDTITNDVVNKFPGVTKHSSTIKNVLTNPIYVGYIQYKNNIYKGVHESIIDESDYEKVQELMKKRTPTSGFSRTYLLSGIIWCGCCNARMHGRTGSKKNGVYNRYYACYTRRASAKHMMTADSCDKVNEPKEKLENAIINEMKKLTIEDVKKASEKEDSGLRADPIKKELKNVDNQLAKLVELFTVGNIPLEILNEKVEVLKDKKEKLTAHLKELEDKKTVDVQAFVETINLLDEFETYDVDTQRLIISQLIDKITVTDDEMVVTWAF